jgi:hypothetical protein
VSVDTEQIKYLFGTYDGVTVETWKVYGPGGAGMGDVSFQGDDEAPLYSCGKANPNQNCWVLDRYLPDGETLPGYFQPVKLGGQPQVSAIYNGFGGTTPIPVARPPKTYDPPEVNERLMPAPSVPTRSECTNTVGLPKLCTSGADSDRSGAARPVPPGGHL